MKRAALIGVQDNKLLAVVDYVMLLWRTKSFGVATEAKNRGHYQQIMSEEDRRNFDGTIFALLFTKHAKKCITVGL